MPIVPFLFPDEACGGGPIKPLDAPKENLYNQNLDIKTDMVLISAPSMFGSSQKDNPAELAIDMIDGFRGIGGIMLVSGQVFEYLRVNNPDVFEYAQSRNIQIVKVPC
jgi:hypothetical protein